MSDKPPSATSATPSRPARWLPHFRFSLRTILILSLLAGSIGALWTNFDAWTEGVKLPGGQARMACFSPDERRIIAQEDSWGSVTVWDASTGAEIRRYELDRNVNIHVSPVGPVLWTKVERNDQLPVQPAEAELRERLSMKISFEMVDTPLKDALSLFTALTKCEVLVSPEAETRAAENESKVNLRLTDMKADMALSWIAKVLELTVDFTRGKILLTTEVELSRDKSSLWALRDAETQAIRWVVRREGEPAFWSPSAFSENGKYVCAHMQGGLLLVYDVATGKEVARVLPRDRADYNGVYLSEDGRFLAGWLGYDTIEGINLATGEKVSTFKAPFPEMTYSHTALSADGSRLFAWGSVWNTKSGERLTSLDCQDPRVYPKPPFSPSRIAIANSKDRCINIHDAGSGKVLASVAHGRPTLKVGFSPDGSKALSSDFVGKQELWDVTTGKRLFQFPPDRRPFWEKWLRDPPEVVIDERTADCRMVTNPGHRFSADGKRLIIDEWDGLTVWNRRRPEPWWGLAWLPEFWSTVVLAALLVWSLWRDRPLIAVHER